PVSDFGAAFDDAADLQVDACCELLDVVAALETALGERLDQGTDRPPEGTQTVLRGDAFDARDRIAHCLRAVVVTAQPVEKPALKRAALLGKVRRQLVRGNRLPRS